MLELELYIQGFESEIILAFLECTVSLWLFGACVCVGELCACGESQIISGILGSFGTLYIGHIWVR